MEGIKEAVEEHFITSSSSYQPGSTSTNPQIQSLQGQVTALQDFNSSLTTQVQALTSLVKSQHKDIQTLVDSHKHLQMQNFIALGAIMGKLNISLPSLPEQVRPEIFTPLLMPVNKTKGKIEARLTRSRTSQQKVQGAEMNSKEADLDMERLIRRASELDIFISKVRAITREDTMLLTVLRDAHIAAFPEAYLQPNKDITYICPTTRQFRHFKIPRQCVMSNQKLIMILGTSLKANKNKNNDGMEMIKLLRRYPDNAEVNLPKTQFNNDDLDNDVHKKSDQNPSGSNPSQSSKPSGSKGGEKKKEDDKKYEERKRRDEDHFQHLVEEIVRVWIVSLREFRLYFKEGKFTLLDKKLMDSLDPTEIKRVISLLKGKDTVTRACRSSLAEWLIKRDETKKRDKAKSKERRRRHDEEIDIADGVSRFFIEFLDQELNWKSELTEDRKLSELKPSGLTSALKCGYTSGMKSG
ncbi:hypothetical protein AgCh_018245 [Apium graveolens]